jgi:asparagine synthase (glutamine-hydrolysing)
VLVADDVPYVMSPTEIVLGFMPGYFEAAAPTVSTASPREVLEEVVRAALSRPPCGVAFSGGRDSSAVLAVATDVARREGLPDPVPITRVFPGITEAAESQWQERVVRHLDLDDWQRVVLRDDVDAIGPVARQRLLEYGVLWPPNLAGDVPVTQAVQGGSLIDGEGGDEVLGDDHHRVADIMRLVRAPRPVRWGRIRAALESGAPSVVRAQLLRRRLGHRLTWLTPAGRQLVLDTLAAEERRRPLSYAASLRLVPRKRKQVLAARNRRLLAARSDVALTSPLLHPDFIHALARQGGTLGPGDRTAVLRDLVPDLLPDDVLTRTDKGDYTRCYMGRPMREFAARWNGAGVDRELVDADELQRLWASGRPVAPTTALLQSAWLATDGKSGAVTEPSSHDVANGTTA